ncbi:MAG TPA: S8 family serine peptidase [Gaiellaceae bacterium]|nr:S8 family serine peptidase [Gaiellaceae bacterium]
MDRLRRRGALALVIAAVTLLAGLAQTAQAAHGPKSSPQGTPPGLLDKAKANPQQTFHVIIRGARGVPSSGVAAAFGAASHGHLGRVFSSINGIAATINGAELTALSHNPNILSIVVDSAVAPVGIEESMLWRSATGADSVPSLTVGANLPAIAIVDSGIDATKTDDFGSRIVASVNLNSDNPSASGDDEGHGTMVAGIAAGGSSLYPGVVPTAPIVSIRTADANGASHMSDVIAACDWILQNQSAYNIRVVNLSLVSEAQTSFVNDPLDAAVEQLWFHGVFVVAAAGNYGQPGGVLMAHSPGNDPFVLTVGALDTNGTAAPADDFAAPWSAYGHTGDGFAKPEISAPGRWIAAPVPPGSTLATTAPDRIVAPGYMWMSGTSLAAPMVAGAADAILGLHPDWTPGQVKAALMLGSDGLPSIGDYAGGVGELDAAKALEVTRAPDADANLEQFVAPDGSGFNGAAFEQAATDWSATDWSATDWSATDWSATDWSATDWSATDWSATDWSATDWSATDWSATDWSATDWSATDWSAALWRP